MSYQKVQRRNNLILKFILLLMVGISALMVNTFLRATAHNEEAPELWAQQEHPEPTGVVITLAPTEPQTTEPVTEPEPTEPEPWPERVAFLTFDDGPSWNTERLLDVLNDYEVPAIFFVQGASFPRIPNSFDILNRILAEGHYVGLHSMTHQFNLLYEGEGAAGRFVDEMLQLQDIIYEASGHFTNLCRAPFGMMSGFRPDSGHQEAIDAAGIYCIDWNIDPADWRNSSEMILSYVINQVEMFNFPSEVVVVMHENDSTIAALPAVISYLRSHGYVFKTYTPGHQFNY